MTDNTTDETTEIFDTAADEINTAAEQPMTLQEFIDELIADPQLGADSHQYLLNAINSFGRETVIEKGEEKQRYQFFNDPANNGEHAVLGNTDMLNAFVRDLKAIAHGAERMQKIILFSGPTATGKSELKRCIVNGLREYSKTDAGRRYTCEWNVSSLSNPDRGGLSYDTEMTATTETGEWYRSPVQIPPYAVLPQHAMDELNDALDDRLESDIQLDPFSKEAYTTLKDYYEQQSGENVFRSLTDPQHLRVRRYTVDETQGIGVLTVEDSGSVKERLLGEWMPSLFKILDSRGRKNPQAFSYDGVLSQGNQGVTIVEDASAHIEMLTRLLNIPDEGYAKIDKQIGLDVDTVPIFISNPDLDAQLEQADQNKKLQQAIQIQDLHGNDPLKALKRRMNRYSFRYLTGLENEVRLLHSELTGTKPEWETGSDRLYEPTTLDGTEFAPHTFEAAALYDVTSRLTESNTIHETGGSEQLSFSDKALLFDRGYVETTNGERLSYDELSFEDETNDGKFGIPITYTRDIISGLAQTDVDIQYPEEVLEAMADELEDHPMFTNPEYQEFSDRVGDVQDYIFQQQKVDVIKAILRDKRATETAVEEYVENVYSWADGEEHDPIEMRLFETDYLGMEDDEYTNQSPSDTVEAFRNERIIQPLNKYVWNQRGNDFGVEDLPLTEVPLISSLIGRYNWSDVVSTYEDIDPVSWNNPRSNTQTAEIKSQCIDNMVDMFDYSPESAAHTSEKVISQSRDKITDRKEQLDAE